jgi:prepilin-type N-terminal cleavage/methylation domain-containing protein
MTAIDKRWPRKATAPGRAAGGFTLVEVMVVIVILGILVSLTIGVGRYVSDETARRTTLSTQAIIMSAINAYYDVRKDYPAEANTSAGSTDALAGVRIRGLWDQLVSEPASAKVLQNLSSDAKKTAERWFVDGYGKLMDYRKSLGLGGVPVLISAGRDRNFVTEPDNIRSDKGR